MNGGDLQGANTRTFTYQRNNLNQYTSISPVDPYDVTGEAAASATVTIDGIAAQRNGPWFRGEFNAPNNTTAAYPGNVVQVVSGGVTNTASVSTFVGPNNTEFDYDDDGNLTRDARWDYTWDAENRCTKMATRTDLPTSVPRLTIEYTYDAAGNRLRKLVLDGAGIVTSNTRYMWLGNMLMSEWSPSTLLRTYWWGVDANGKFGGEEGIGALVMCNGISTEAGPMWNDYSLMNVAQDGNGNIVGQFDHFYGTKWREYEYDGFGRMVAERKYGGSAHLDKVPLRHATRILDPETGLQAYHYRLYSPWLGRWLSRDPIGEAGGLNLYGMVGNNPVNAVDPLGLCGGPYFIPSENINEFANYWANGGATRQLGETAAIAVPVIVGTGVTIYTGGAALPFLTSIGLTSTEAVVGAGVLSGVAGGFTSQVTSNTLNGAPILEGTRRAALWGAALNGGLAFIGNGLQLMRQGFQEAKALNLAVELAKQTGGRGASGVMITPTGEVFRDGSVRCSQTLLTTTVESRLAAVGATRTTCVEGRLISQAERAGVQSQGSTIAVADNSFPYAGSLKPACDFGCSKLLPTYGIGDAVSGTHGLLPPWLLPVPYFPEVDRRWPGVPFR